MSNPGVSVDKQAANFNNAETFSKGFYTQDSHLFPLTAVIGKSLDLEKLKADKAVEEAYHVKRAENNKTSSPLFQDIVVEKRLEMGPNVVVPARKCLLPGRYDEPFSLHTNMDPPKEGEVQTKAGKTVYFKPKSALLWIAAEEMARGMGEKTNERPWGRDAMVKKSGNTLYAAGSVSDGYGRIMSSLAVTSKKLPSHLRAVTLLEARQAMVDIGMGDKPDPVAHKLQLLDLSNSDVFVDNNTTLSQHSGMGSPVMVNYSIAKAKPELVLNLDIWLTAMRGAFDSDLKGRRDAIHKKMLDLASSDLNWLVVAILKTKVDNYSAEKIRNFKMRLYNVLPKHIIAYLAMASQPFERGKKTILDMNSQSHNFQSCSFLHGGADLLVQRLQRQITNEGEAFVTNGDDTICGFVWKEDDDYCMSLFDLDGTSFDWTFRMDVNRTIVEEFHDRMAHISPNHAGVWRSLTLKRLVLACGIQTVYLENGNPSGMVCVSSLNGAGMSVAVRRVLTRLTALAHKGAPINREVVEEVVIAEGGRLGYDLRLGAFEIVRSKRPVTVLEYLKVHPTLFCGYYMHVRDGVVFAHCDLPRSMAQLRTLKGAFLKGEPGIPGSANAKVKVLICGVLASYCVNLGYPQEADTLGFANFVSFTLKLINELTEGELDTPDDKLKYVVLLGEQCNEQRYSLRYAKTMLLRYFRVENGESIFVPDPLGIWSPDDYVEGENIVYQASKRLPTKVVKALRISPLNEAADVYIPTKREVVAKKLPLPKVVKDASGKPVIGLITRKRVFTTGETLRKYSSPSEPVYRVHEKREIEAAGIRADRRFDIQSGEAFGGTDNEGYLPVKRGKSRKGRQKK